MRTCSCTVTYEQLLSRVWRCVDAPLFRRAGGVPFKSGRTRTKGQASGARLSESTYARGERDDATPREKKPKNRRACFVDGALGMSRRLVVSITRALFSAQAAPASPKRVSSPRAVDEKKKKPNGKEVTPRRRTVRALITSRRPSRATRDRFVSQNVIGAPDVMWHPPCRVTVCRSLLSCAPR